MRPHSGRGSQACESTGWTDWACVDTLAMAYAAMGDFQTALQRAKQAERIAPPENRAAVQQRIALYSAGEPYRARQSQDREQ